MICYSDTETYCETPIQAGEYRYAERSEVMLWAYAVDDGPCEVWDRTSGAPMPPALCAAVAAALAGDGVFVFHKAAFDRTVLRHAGYPIPIESTRCTMAQALAHALPGGLEKLGEVLGLAHDQRKLTVGRQLVQLFCKPRPAGHRATSKTHPVEWARFIEYAAQDVIALREIHRKLPAWNYQGAELALWHLDQRINDRGIAVDLPLAHAAIEAAERCRTQFERRTGVLTNGDVRSTTQRDALLAHILAAHGVSLPDLRADTLERRIDDPELPATVRELLAIRLQASLTSVSKYKTLRRAVCSDGRLRGLLQFDGAGRTGRWAGRIFQPQNLTRIPGWLKKVYDEAIESIKRGTVDQQYENPMEVLSGCVRGALIAGPQRKLVVSDLANIEGRVAAWIAGEAWKLDAFRAFDQGTGPDLYKVAYGKAFGVPASSVEDGSHERQIGKVMELMLQYQGGVGAFITGAATYGIDLDAMAEAAYPQLPQVARVEAAYFLDWTKATGRDTFGLADKTFIVCDAFKRLWRRAHPEITALWDALEDAARAAIHTHGTVVPCRRVAFERRRNWLLMHLPSGRALCYPSPAISEGGGITYRGMHQYTRRWQRLGTYGGKLLENATQAIARDTMAAAMAPAERAGFPIVLTVHDELITEPLDAPEYSVQQLSALLATPPAWAADLPLAAAGYESRRYKKE